MFSYLFIQRFLDLSRFVLLGSKIVSQSFALLVERGNRPVTLGQ